MNKKSEFSFDIIAEHENGLGRAGVIHTPHGDIETPTFAPVGTYGEVIHLSPERLREIGTMIVMCNGFHLSGKAEEIDNAGGLAEFNKWSGPTMTDSGGFQVMKLGAGNNQEVKVAGTGVKTTIPSERLARVTEDGVYFKKDKDSDEVLWTPEYSMQFQHQIGADIIMAFDELTAVAEDYDYNKEALDRTHRWAVRCIAEHQKLTKERSNKPYQALFGVLQGGHWEDLRREAGKTLGSHDEFDGFGIGGSFDFDKATLAETIRWCNEELPKDKPRHLLGLSYPENIFDGVENGCDTFDCVAPTHVARTGWAYSIEGNIKIRNSEYRDDERLLSGGCGCLTCVAGYSRAKIRALYMNTDGLKSVQDANSDRRIAQELLSVHNVYFTIDLTKKIRQSIIDGTFNEFRDQWLARYYSK